MTMRKTRGFTLIEIMITVAIIGILVAIAFPSYQQHLRKGRRATAQAFMMDVANREQQYLLDARNYAVGGGAFTTLNVAPPSSLNNFYTFTVTPAAPTAPPSFTITATAMNQQLHDGDLVIDNTGAKSRVVAGGTGWQEPAGTYPW